jgi:MFS family permease
MSLEHLKPAPAADVKNTWRTWLRRQQLSREFWIFFSAALFFDFGFSIYFFFINLYLSDLGFRENLLGFAAGALTLGSVTATLPVGSLARRFGLRPILLTCFTVAPAIGIIRLFAPLPALQIGLAFAAGIAMCCWAVCYAPVLARITDVENRSLGFSLVFSAGIGSSAVGGILCGYLTQWLGKKGIALSAMESKRLILISACLIAAAGIFAVSRLRLPKLESFSTGMMLKFPPYLRRFLPAMALWTTVCASFVPFAGVYFSRSLGMSIARVSFIFSLSQLAQLCGGLIAPALFRVAGLLPTIVYTQLATAAGMAGLAAATRPTVAISLFLTFTATQWMNSPGIYSLLMSSVPEDAQTSASAWTNLCNSLLQAGGAALAGIVITHFGYQKFLAGLACLAIAAAFLFRTLLGQSKAPENVTFARH